MRVRESGDKLAVPKNLRAGQSTGNVIPMQIGIHARFNEALALLLALRFTVRFFACFVPFT
jgi:hypothetical protein